MKRLLALTVVAALSACATSSPDVVSRYEAQRMSTIYDGTVLSTRPVTVEGSQSGIGSVAGAVGGGIAGSSAGRSGSRESAVVAIAGAIVGGILGNAAERYGTREEAVEVLVQLKNGERRSIVQAKAGEALNPGDPVVLVTTGGRVRVTKAPVPTPPAPPAPAPTS